MSLKIKSFTVHGVSVHQTVPRHVTPADQFTYTSNGSAITITDYIGEDTDIVIPSSITGLPVRTIGNDAIKFKSGLISITIPDSVTSIGTSAIAMLPDLLSIVIGNSVASIGDGALTALLSIQTITIPASVTSLGIPFNSCYALTDIIVVVANPQYASVDGVLFNKTLTNMVKYPEANVRPSYTIPTGTTTINTGAAISCNNLTEIIFPTSITSVQSFAICPSLLSASFLGNAPTIGSIFSTVDPSFKIYYPTSATGWTTPTWHGFATVPV